MNFSNSILPHPVRLFTHVCTTRIFLLCKKEQIEVMNTVNRFVSISAKFGICTVVVLNINGTLVEAKIRTWDS